MARTFTNLGTLTIANGGTTSTVLSLTPGPGQSIVALSIQGPSALTAVVTAQVTLVDGGTFGPLFISGAAANVTCAALIVTTVPWVAARQLRLVAASAEGADRVFTIGALLEA